MCPRSRPRGPTNLLIPTGSDLAPSHDVEVGQQLFEARQRRGLTLDDISRTTKIPISLLHAIERNDTTRLPQPFFTRTLVRAYATELGVDADSVVDGLEKSAAESLPMQPHAASMPIDDRTSSRSFIGAIALCAACIMYAGFARQTGAPAMPQVAIESVAQPVPANAGSTADPPPCVAAPVPPSPVRAAHPPTTSASSEQIVTPGTTAVPAVKHVSAEDTLAGAPADEIPATTPEPADIPADQNPAPAPPSAEQL